MFFLENWIRFLVAFILGIAIMIIYMFLQTLQISESTGQALYPWDKLFYYQNGFFISAVVLFGIGILAIVGNFGAFNIFSYYFRRKKKENGYKENYYEYSERKRLEASSRKLIFLPYFILATIYLITAFVLYAFIFI